MRRTAVAIAFGLLLASLPFVRYRCAAPHPTVHADHRPRHGGELVMAGDVHLELVRRGQAVEVYVSDEYRRPMTGLSGHVEPSEGARIELRPDGERLLGEIPAGAGRLRLTVRLPGGEEAGATFDPPGVP